MPDAYADLRVLPLRDVLSWLGVNTEWKSRKDKQENYGPCPIHQAQKNQTSFSFDSTGRFFCFSCGKHGKGALDLVMAVKGLGFNQSVDLLRSNTGNIIAQQAARPQIKQLQAGRG